MKRNRKIVLGVTGSIAAYKAAELVRLMMKEGWDVSVVMTRAATEFVGELTFRTLSRNPVVVDMFRESPNWQPDHISLADAADLLVIAPCTANVIAKLAVGIADDALTATALACRAPLVIAPAMNEGMLDNPATVQNMKTLRDRNMILVDTSEGDLACGYSGRGRMAEPALILDAVRKTLGEKSRK